MVHKDHGPILFAIVSACVVGKNQNIPNWSSMADDAITQGGIEVLGSPFSICGLHMNCAIEMILQYSVRLWQKLAIQLITHSPPVENLHQVFHIGSTNFK